MFFEATRQVMEEASLTFARLAEMASEQKFGREKQALIQQWWEAGEGLLQRTGVVEDLGWTLWMEASQLQFKSLIQDRVLSVVR